MKVKFGVIIVAARGTVGGMTLSANAAGPYAKPWSRSPNPRTLPQSVVRSFLGQLAISWRGLSAANRTAWNTFAALPAQDLIDSLGNTYSASGFNWYIRLGIHALMRGAVPLTSPAGVMTPATVTILTFTVTTVPAFTVTYAGNPFAGFFFVVTMAKSFSDGLLSKEFDYKWTASSGVASPATKSFTAQGVAAFGTPQMGDRYYLRVFKEQTGGRRSAPFAIATTVIA